MANTNVGNNAYLLTSRTGPVTGSTYRVTTAGGASSGASGAAQPGGTVALPPNIDNIIFARDSAAIDYFWLGPGRDGQKITIYNALISSFAHTIYYYSLISTPTTANVFTTLGGIATLTYSSTYGWLR